MRLLATGILTLMASATALAQPAPSTPSLTPPDVPRTLPSARLLQLRPVAGFFSIPYEVQQGPYTFHGSQLTLAVVASPEALALARDGLAKFNEGNAFLIAGTVTALAGLVTVIASAAAYPRNGVGDTTASTVLVSTSLGLVLVALALDIVGAGLVTDGMKTWFEAVNTYNRQLTDGQLQPIPSG